MPPRAAAGRRARPDSVDEKDDAQAAVGAKRRPPAKRAEPKSKRPAADSSRTAKDADMDMDIDETVLATNGAGREAEEPPPAATKASPRGTGAAQAGKVPATSPPLPARPLPWSLGWGGGDVAEGSGDAGGGWGLFWGGSGGGSSGGSGDGVARVLADGQSSPAQRRDLALGTGEVARGASSPLKRKGRGAARGGGEKAGKVVEKAAGGGGKLPYAQTPVSARISRNAATRESQLLREHRAQGFSNYILGEISDLSDTYFEPVVPTDKEEWPARIPPFMKVPRLLERTITVGVLICFDSFLFNFTLLPFRSLSALLSAIFRGRVHRSTPEDLSRTALLVISLYFLNKVDISYLYHYIRGQMSSYIKLYVIYNVLEVFDRLLCSLGHDIFENMSQWTLDPSDSDWRGWIRTLFRGRGDSTREEGGGDLWENMRTLLYMGMAGVYVVAHSTVLLIQVVTLNVAINSQNNALITLLVANNFTELKGHVFKKCDEGVLLQVLCADMVERFQMIVCLSLVTLQNMSKDTQVWNSAWAQDWGSMVAIVWLTEHLVDWVKHAFITKFNKIEPEVYNRYRDVIWEHVCNAWRLRQPHRVAKHVGFVSLPLACVAARVIQHSLPPTAFTTLYHHIYILGPLCILWWLSLCLIKTQLYLVLLGHACRTHYGMIQKKPPPLSPKGPKGTGPKGKGQASSSLLATPNLTFSEAPEEKAPEEKNRERVQELMAVDVFTRALKVAPEPPAARPEDAKGGTAAEGASSAEAGGGVGGEGVDGMSELSLGRTYLTGAEDFN